MLSITLQHATVAYKKQVLFENVHLHLPAASCTCILGPSGVGKSTLLQLFTDLPMQDAVVVNKQLTTSDALPLTGRIAWLSQSDNLLPWASILDNVLIGYRLRNQSTASLQAKARDLLQQVGFSQQDLLKKIIALSGGMRQRVALVRTLLEDKALILLDEPFSALDSITRFELQTLTAKLLQQKSVLLITHDPLEALRLADYMYVLKGMPAKLHAVNTPTSATPRALTHDLLQQQAVLWQRLLEA